MNMAAAFGVNPYVIMETYTAGSCVAAKHSCLVYHDTWEQVTDKHDDGKCHKTTRRRATARHGVRTIRRLSKLTRTRCVPRERW
ncbi:hypothetical protein Pcac1_g12855 [Phytophthora cactorum]|nr:hypothetical protein Pcac1_g12855 [Phytophthora cactorum]